MAMQISSMTLKKDDRVQLLKQMLSLHTGLDTSHHIHRLDFRWLKDWTTAGKPDGLETEMMDKLATYQALKNVPDRKSSL